MTEPQIDLDELKQLQVRATAFREGIDRPADTDVPAEFIELTPEQKSARNRRNIMLALSILAFVTLVFFITIARLKAGAPL